MVFGKKHPYFPDSYRFKVKKGDISFFCNYMLKYLTLANYYKNEPKKGILAILVLTALLGVAAVPMFVPPVLADPSGKECEVFVKDKGTKVCLDVT
jgi:hypothetical protein